MTPTRALNSAATPDKKPKGCFQCSKRRITCDLGHPTCNKCIKKGTECSGLGRIRFNDGVARRGKLKGRQVPVLEPAGEDPKQPVSAPVQLRWQHRRKNISKDERSDERSSKRARTSDRRCIEFARTNSTHLITTDSRSHRFTAQKQSCSFSALLEQPSSVDRRIDPALRMLFSRQSNSLQPWISPLDPGARMFFSHFSQAVAPVMVVLDNVSNGYRDLILPMACEDEVLRRAVGVVAAQHLSQKRPDLQSIAEAGRAAVISRLRRDALQSSLDQVFNVFTWATLIVLLVGETVTGSNEYGYLVQMLLCLSRSRSDNQPIDQTSSVEAFLTQQTHMFEFLSAPLLLSAANVTTTTTSSSTPPQSQPLPTPTSAYLSFLTYPTLPQTSPTAALISTTRQAFLLASSLANQTSSPSSSPPPPSHPSALHRLRHLVEQIPPDAPGAHALVWVCFVGAAAAAAAAGAAADSRGDGDGDGDGDGGDGADAAHAAYFVDRMRRIHAQTGFANIPKAIGELERRRREKRERSGGGGGGAVAGSSVLVM